jgi:hypothetical protein
MNRYLLHGEHELAELETAGILIEDYELTEIRGGPKVALRPCLRPLLKPQDLPTS